MKAKDKIMIMQASDEFLQFMGRFWRKYGPDATVACLTGAFDFLEEKTGIPAEAVTGWIHDAIIERKTEEAEACSGRE